MYLYNRQLNSVTKNDVYQEENIFTTKYRGREEGVLFSHR